MYIISTRKNFIDPDKGNASEHGVIISEIRKVDLRTGTIDDEQTENLLEQVKDKNVLLLLHGYNNTWEKVRRAYNILETNFNQIFTSNQNEGYDHIIGFIWPGGDHGWEYPIAKKRAGEHIEPLANLLIDLSSQCTIDIMTHSLGCYLTLSSLTFYLPNMNSKLIRNVFLTAAAVDNESIEKGEHFYRATQTCEKVYIFHSRNDGVLMKWYPIGDFGNRALGLKGVENINKIIKHSKNVKIIDCRNVIYGHGDYKHNEQTYYYIFNELNRTDADQFVTLEK